MRERPRLYACDPCKHEQAANIVQLLLHKVWHSTHAVAEEENDESDESYDTDMEGTTDTVSDSGRSPGTSSTSAASAAAVTDCSAHCCDPQHDSPYHPTKLTRTRRVQGSGKSKQTQKVQVGWFKQHSWLSLCETRQHLFCFLLLMC